MSELERHILFNRTNSFIHKERERILNAKIEQDYLTDILVFYWMRWNKMIKIERIDEKKDREFDITIRIQNKGYTKEHITKAIREGATKQNTSCEVELMLKKLADIIEQS